MMNRRQLNSGLPRFLVALLVVTYPAFAQLEASAANTTLEPGSIELAATTGVSAVKSPAIAGLTTSVEFTVSFRRRWGAYCSFAFTPEWTGSGSRTKQQLHYLQFGIERQVYYRRVGRVDIFPYVLGGLGLRSADSTTVGADDRAFTETFSNKPVAAWGGGARLLPHSSASFGLRIEYREMVPLTSPLDFERQHTLSAGFFIQRKSSRR